jgi:hypothetical protein
MIARLTKSRAPITAQHRAADADADADADAERVRA